MMTSLETAYDPPPAHEDALHTETPGNVAGASNPAADVGVRGQQEGLDSALSAAFVAVKPTPQVPSVCQQLYVDSGNDKMVL